MDGMDIRRFAVAALWNQISTMFQFPMRYQAIAAENIGVGSIEQNPSRDEIVAAAKHAGADDFISKLPKTYDTLLGKWFTTGTDLDRKSTRLNSSHVAISYAVACSKKKKDD